MKRIVITLTVLFSLVSLSSFAKEEKVNARVLESFQSSFKNATEVDWTVSENFYKADFSLNGQYVAAYYDDAGQLIALTRNISSTQLPISLQTSLKKDHEAYWISDLFEVANEQGTTYYVTLENADTKLVLKSSGTNWNHYQKQRKS
ncbi:MAG TPA: hypothetical protein VFS22_04660 [Flavisolibacter sp.]|nr:hypothetical protein [Flavisolibacter sp.]